MKISSHNKTDRILKTRNKVYTIYEMSEQPTRELSSSMNDAEATVSTTIGSAISEKVVGETQREYRELKELEELKHLLNVEKKKNSNLTDKYLNAMEKMTELSSSMAELSSSMAELNSTIREVENSNGAMKLEMYKLKTDLEKKDKLIEDLECKPDKKANESWADQVERKESLRDVENHASYDSDSKSETETKPLTSEKDNTALIRTSYSKTNANKPSTGEKPRMITRTFQYPRSNKIKAGAENWDVIIQIVNTTLHNYAENFFRKKYLRVCQIKRNKENEP